MQFDQDVGERTAPFLLGGEEISLLERQLSQNLDRHIRGSQFGTDRFSLRDMIKAANNAARVRGLYTAWQDLTDMIQEGDIAMISRQLSQYPVSSLTVFSSDVHVANAALSALGASPGRLLPVRTGKAEWYHNVNPDLIAVLVSSFTLRLPHDSQHLGNVLSEQWRDLGRSLGRIY